MKSQTAKIESLESRTFLSATLDATTAPAAQHSAVTIPIIPVVAGPTIHATAGTPFTGEVGFYQTGVLDPPLGYSATINWGDGTAATKATLTYGKSGTKFGLIISGTHTYAKAGDFVAKVTLVTAPIMPGSVLPTTIVEIIADKAIVAKLPANTSGGLTITEPVNKKFTATLGTFVAIAPNTTYEATITWGDGSVSQGTVTGNGVQGLDELKFKITGTHTYALAGKYGISITIYKPVAKGSDAVLLVTTIQSTADVIGPVVTPV